MKIGLLFVITAPLFLVGDGSKILVSAPFGTKSHQNTYVQLVNELAKRGHDLTIISNYAVGEFKNKKNIREIVIKELAVDMSRFPSFMSMIFSPDYWAIMKMIYNGLFEQMAETAEKTFSHHEVRQLVNSNEKFDLVLLLQSCALVGYPIAWALKAPMILLSPNSLMPGTATFLGDFEHYSYVPFLLTSYTDKMTLYERTMSMLKSKVFAYFGFSRHTDSVRSIAQKKLFPNCPPLEEIERNVSLVFTNTHPSFTYPRTLPPQVIEVGGLHCKPANPLPEVIYKINIFTLHYSIDFNIKKRICSHLCRHRIPDSSCLQLAVTCRWTICRNF